MGSYEFQYRALNITVLAKLGAKKHKMRKLLSEIFRLKF